MANVIPLWRGDHGPRNSDRGQLFLIGALALAVVLIALALLLNTAIYTENLATRSGGANSAEVIGYQTAAQEHATAELKQINREHDTSDTYTDLQSNYTASIDTWESSAARHQAAKGHVTSVTVSNTTEGTRIVQNESRQFTDDSSNGNWTLADDTNARNYTMTIDTSGEYEESDIDNLTDDPVFRIAFGSDVSLYIYENTTGEITVAVADPSDTIERREIDNGSRINITNATINGEYWDALRFFDELGDDYKIEYENGDNATGTYSLTVDRPVDSGPYHSDDTGESPWTTPALYDADFDLIYETPTTYYETEFRIAPGEPDA